MWGVSGAAETPVTGRRPDIVGSRFGDVGQPGRGGPPLVLTRPQDLDRGEQVLDQLIQLQALLHRHPGAGAHPGRDEQAAAVLVRSTETVAAPIALAPSIISYPSRPISGHSAGSDAASSTGTRLARVLLATCLRLSLVTSASAPVPAASAEAVQVIRRRWTTTWSRPSPASCLCPLPRAMRCRIPGGWNSFSRRAWALRLVDGRRVRIGRSAELYEVAGRASAHGTVCGDGGVVAAGQQHQCPVAGGDWQTDT